MRGIADQIYRLRISITEKEQDQSFASLRKALLGWCEEQEVAVEGVHSAGK